jgi:hypothetical protein
MNISTLPRVAGLVRDEGPFYAAHNLIDPVHGDERDVVWLAAPVLTGPTMRWATDDEVTSPHVELTVTAIAELLFAADVEPDQLADDDVMLLLVATLRRCRCDLTECAALLGQEYGEHPEVAVRRMGKCVQRAARLLKVEA